MLPTIFSTITQISTTPSIQFELSFSFFFSNNLIEFFCPALFFYFCTADLNEVFNWSLISTQHGEDTLLKLIGFLTIYIYSVQVAILLLLSFLYFGNISFCGFLLTICDFYDLLRVSLIFYQYLFIVAKVVCLLISIAFFTLAERKIMAILQRRQGPNVIGFWGVLQPLADGLKLLAKELIIPSKSTARIFVAAPIILFTFTLLSWSVIPFNLVEISEQHSATIVTCAVEVSTVDASLDTRAQTSDISNIQYSILFILVLSSLNVYALILAGWSSNSKYSFLGALRSAAQMISYEVAIGLVILPVILLAGSLNLAQITFSQGDTLWFLFPLLPCCIIFFVSMLAETNRAPFDLPEAEAELVAGYNVEYASIGFAMLFLAEYCNMLLMSMIFVLIFIGGWEIPLNSCLPLLYTLQLLFLSIKVVFFCFTFVWVRATLPRYRYDQLMAIGWKAYLPFTLSFLVFAAGFLLMLEGLPYNFEIEPEVSYYVQNSHGPVIYGLIGAILLALLLNSKITTMVVVLFCMFWSYRRRDGTYFFVPQIQMLVIFFKRLAPVFLYIDKVCIWFVDPSKSFPKFDKNLIWPHHIEAFLTHLDERSCWWLYHIHVGFFGELNFWWSSFKIWTMACRFWKSLTNSFVWAHFEPGVSDLKRKLNHLPRNFWKIISLFLVIFWLLDCTLVITVAFCIVSFVVLTKISPKDQLKEGRRALWQFAIILVTSWAIYSHFVVGLFNNRDLEFGSIDYDYSNLMLVFSYLTLFWSYQTPDGNYIFVPQLLLGIIKNLIRFFLWLWQITEWFLNTTDMPFPGFPKDVTGWLHKVDIFFANMSDDLRIVQQKAYLDFFRKTQKFTNWITGWVSALYEFLFGKIRISLTIEQERYVKNTLRLTSLFFFILWVWDEAFFILVGKLMSLVLFALISYTIFRYCSFRTKCYFVITITIWVLVILIWWFQPEPERGLGAAFVEIALIISLLSAFAIIALNYPKLKTPFSKMCLAIKLNSFFLLMLVFMSGLLFFSLYSLSHPLLAAHQEFAFSFYTNLLKSMIAVTSFLALLLAYDYLRNCTRIRIEYPLLIMFSVLFLFLLISSYNLVNMYVSIVGFSLNLYVLLLLDKHPAPREAGLKYFFLSTYSTGLLLFGIFLIYFLYQTTNFFRVRLESYLHLLAGKGIVAVITQWYPVTRYLPFFGENNFLLSYFNSYNKFFFIHLDKLLFISACFLMVGFLFKLAAFPCHWWTPEIYDATYPPVLVYFILPVKLAVFGFFIRLLNHVLPQAALICWDQIIVWKPIIILATIGSLSFGCYKALEEHKIRRFLAYTSINQMGFLLLGVCSNTFTGYTASLIYLALYFVMNVPFLCIFLLTYKVLNEKIRAKKRFPFAVISDLSDFGEFNRFYAYALSITVFSMAGLPFTAGFFGKFYLLASTFKAYPSLVAIALFTSLASTAYYIRFVKATIFENAWFFSNPNLFSHRLPFGIELLIIFCIIFLLIFIGTNNVVYTIFEFLAAAAVLVHPFLAETLGSRNL